jgi:predicted house-cleaning noncanonical NTP pyrophosphatase (MazG superfamily)
MKLVRDKIPSIIIEDGRNPIYHIATSVEYKRELFRKVIEELEEFREEPCLEEAADLVEVVHTLIEAHGFGFADVVETGIRKAQLVGGFNRGIILDSVE